MSSNEETSKPQRVVSLLGASTETIYRLGLGHVLVGRSHECDYPPACLSLPCISQPRLDPELPSVDIDNAVRELASRGEPVYKLQDELLLSLEPDLLIAQDHCRVCAITANDLDGSCHNIPQLIVRPSNLKDCFDNVTQIADALGYPGRGARLVATMEERMNRVKHLAQELKSDSAPKVALLEWCDPIMGCGYWLTELIENAGGIATFASPPGGATPSLSFFDLDGQADVIVLALCGFSISRSIQEIQKAWTSEQISKLQRQCPVFVADGNFLFNRSGPRIVESAEVLLEALYPCYRGHFGHLGSSYLMSLQDALAWKGVETGAVKDRTPAVETPKNEPSDSVTPAESPSAMVNQQLEHLRNGDMAAAFALNSVANQKRWCDAGRFSHVLKCHDDFKRLLKETPAVSGAESGLVKVTLEGGPSLTWTCVVQASDSGAVWRTEKVSP